VEEACEFCQKRGVSDCIKVSGPKARHIRDRVPPTLASYTGLVSGANESAHSDSPKMLFKGNLQRLNWGIQGYYCSTETSYMGMDPDSPEVEDFTATVGVGVPRPETFAQLDGATTILSLLPSIFKTPVNLAMGYDFFPEEQRSRINGFTSVFRCLIEGYQCTLWITLLYPLSVSPPFLSHTLTYLVSLLGCTVVIRTPNDISVKRLVQSEGRVSPQNRLNFAPQRAPSQLIRLPSLPQGGSHIPTKTEELASNIEHFKVDSSLDQAEGIILETGDPEESAQAEPSTNRDVKRESLSPLTAKLAELRTPDFAGLIRLHNEQVVTIEFNLALRPKGNVISEKSFIAGLEMELNHIFIGTSPSPPGLNPHPLQYRLRRVELSLRPNIKEPDNVESQSLKGLFEPQFPPGRLNRSDTIAMKSETTPNLSRMHLSRFEEVLKVSSIIEDNYSKFPDSATPTADRDFFWSYRVVGGVPGRPTKFRILDAHTGAMCYTSEHSPSSICATITCLFEIEDFPWNVLTTSDKVVEGHCRHITTCMNIEVKLWPSPDLNYFPRTIDSGGCRLTLDCPKEDFSSVLQYDSMS
jgi:hypothetical protein